MATVLIIDDTPRVRDMLSQLVRSAGHEPIELPDGSAAVRTVVTRGVDVVLLDIGLPGRDGFAVLDQIRAASDVPVVMVTARNGELDVVRALRAGADDYVPKPFRRQELLARVDAAVRRRPQARAVPDVREAALSIDFAARHAVADGRHVPLSDREWRLLAALVSADGAAVSTTELFEHVWGSAHGDTTVVRVYIGYLRRKLGRRSKITTLRGLGYRWGEPGESSGDADSGA